MREKYAGFWSWNYVTLIKRNSHLRRTTEQRISNPTRSQNKLIKKKKLISEGAFALKDEIKKDMEERMI
jgi:hypothetical protein